MSLYCAFEKGASSGGRPGLRDIRSQWYTDGVANIRVGELKRASPKKRDWADA